MKNQNEKEQKEKIKFQLSVKKEAFKLMLKNHWKRISIFLIGYLFAVLDMTYYKQFYIILSNLFKIGEGYFWGSYIFSIIIGYFFLRIFVKLFGKPELEMKNYTKWYKRWFVAYIIFCIGYMTGIIVDLFTEYVKVAFGIMQ